MARIEEVVVVRLKYLPLALLGLLAGCPTRDVSELPIHTTGDSLKTINLSTDIDILFVIDDSASTADKQTVFAQNFPKFIQALDAFPNGRPNVHIGVVSSTVDIGNTGFGSNCSPATSETGLLQNTARVNGCIPPNGRYIEDIATGGGTRQTNYDATQGLDGTFSCIAQLSDKGCGFEAQLEGMKRALDGSRTENAGFLRPGAYLAVIFLTDEDDCSIADKSIFGLSNVGPGDFRCQPMYAYDCDNPIDPTTPATYNNCTIKRGSYLTDPDSYASFLKRLKGDPSKVVVAMIAGDPATTIMTGPITFLNGTTQAMALQPSCNATINGDATFARPGNRLNEFSSQFGSQGTFNTICQSDYTQVLTDIGALLFKVTSPCLDSNVSPTDIDPNSPGIQLACAVSDVQDANTSQQKQEVIPRCPMVDDTTPDPNGPRPCWWAKANATCAGSGLELHIERSSAPLPNTQEQMVCELNRT
jgi:hypothetical protein